MLKTAQAGDQSGGKGVIDWSETPHRWDILNVTLN